jgi:hypothetical protein
VDYGYIYFGVALVLAITSAFMLYFSWRYVEGRLVSRWTLAIALLSGFLAWFVAALLSVLASVFLQHMVIRWLGGNGFSFAAILAMISVLVHYQLLMSLAKK